MQYDVKASGLLASDAIAGGRLRLKAVLISYTATTGLVALSDGASGANKFVFAAPAVGGAVHVLIPGEGILFENSIYGKTITNCTITVFYG